MDPSSLVRNLVHEIALDGIYGTEEENLWDICARECGFPLDAELKAALWQWIAKLPSIQVKNRTLYATEELQWLTLTGHPQSDNVVGNLTFELLCLIAHSRAAGISTVEASKATGQDLRSLFGRVQTLVNLGLVARFPVIENGSSTNRMIYHSYAESHSIGEAAVDKEAISRRIVEFCKSGIQGIRTSKNVIQEIGSFLANTKKSRKRPTIVGCLRDLESLGCVRRISMAHPDYPDRRYSCIEYIKDFESTNIAFSTENGLCAPNCVIYGPDFSLDNDDENVADHSKGDGPNDEDLDTTIFDTENEIPHANTVYPLPSQIYDAVHAAGTQGISAMDLTAFLTGTKFRKALSKYLDGLSAAPSFGPSGEIPQIGHLTLVKGVDFNKRVKFYRYFSKLAYSKDTENPAAWGSFLPDLQADTSLSLKSLDRKLSKPLPGVCSIVRLPNGQLKPVFHGDKEVHGEVVLRSGPTDSTSSVNGNPPKKRGRPRKNEAKVKPEPSPAAIPKPTPEVLEPLSTVILQNRRWTGGTPANLVKSPSLIMRSQIQASEYPFKVLKESHVDIPTPKLAGEERDVKVGSLAMRQRVETLLKIVADNGGHVSGGSSLLEKFNDAVLNQYKIDRRTVNNVVEKLVNDRVLEKIYVSVPTISGKHVMQFILYDPLVHPKPNESPVIIKAKHELIEGGREKHMRATRAALDAAKNVLKRTPVREMTEEQMKAFGPKTSRAPPSRILSTSSRKTQVPRQKTRFGPSAAEVLGVDGLGQTRSRAKRPTRRNDVIKVEEDVVGYECVDEHADVDPNLLIDQPLSSATKYTSTTKAKPKTKELNCAERSEPDLERLARAVIIFRSLFSSGRAHVDWKIIAQCMSPPMSATEARRRWREARDTLDVSQRQAKSSDPVLKKSLQFEELFLKAYELDLVDYRSNQDPIVAIPGYVTWWQKAEVDGLANRLLSQRRDHKYSKAKEVESKASQMFERLSCLSLRERKFESMELDPLSTLQSQVSIVNAEKLLLSTTFSVSARKPGHAPSQLSDVEMRLRAVIAADGGPTYSPEKAARELHGLTNGDTEMARAGLELKRVIQWGESDPEKIPKGRPYVLSEHVHNALTVPKLDLSVPQKMKEDVTFFCGIEQGVEIPATVDEADVMCLIELNTFGLHGKTAKLRRVGERFGLLSTEYKSRGIDKQEFECQLICDVQNQGSSDEILAKPHYVEPPESGNESRPWLWQTRNLTSVSIWFKVAYRILAMVHFRPGITAHSIALAVSNALEYEETLSAVEALIAGGAIEHLEHEGLRAKPNWTQYLWSSADEGGFQIL